MEYVANGDLGVYIKAHGKSQIPEATCQAISRQLLEALQVLHERLICHRDLKPQVNTLPVGSHSPSFLLN